MTTKTKAERAERLARIGYMMYGNRWGAALAESMGISRSTFSMISTGERSVTDDIERRLVNAIVFRRAELERTRKELLTEENALSEDIGMPVPPGADEKAGLYLAIDALFEMPGVSRVQVKELVLDVVRKVAAERAAALKPPPEPAPDLIPSGPMPGM